MRVTLLCRTPEQARELDDKRENEKYLAGVHLPDRLRIRVLGDEEGQFDRADLVFVAVPSAGAPGALEQLQHQGISARAGGVSLAKGRPPPDGMPPTGGLGDTVRA